MVCWEELRLVLEQICWDVERFVRSELESRRADWVDNIPLKNRLIHERLLASARMRLTEPTHVPLLCVLMDARGQVLEALAVRPTVEVIVGDVVTTGPWPLSLPVTAVCIGASVLGDDPTDARNIQVGAAQVFSEGREYFSFVRGQGIVRNNVPWVPFMAAHPLDRLRFHPQASAWFALETVHWRPER